jgi:hypothetical protein
LVKGEKGNFFMPIKIQGNENIRDIFSIFHDGVINYHQLKDRELCLEIEIVYLAERIDPKFKKFKVVLSGVDNVRFRTWPSDLKSEPQIILDVHSIFKPKLTILEGNIKENLIQVVCNQSSSNFEYCGGELFFSVDNAIVTDEADKSYSTEDLGVVCKGYWDAWASKNQMMRASNLKNTE